MRPSGALVALFVAAASAPLSLVDAASAEQGTGERGVELVKADHPGRVPFDRECAPCHGAGQGDDGAEMLPGTAALAQRYEGALPAELELRGDLDADALRLFVRRGIGSMPPFRKAELSEAEVEAIAGYLAATAELNARVNE